MKNYTKRDEPQFYNLHERDWQRDLTAVR